MNAHKWSDPRPGPRILAIDPGGTTGLFEAIRSDHASSHELDPDKAADYIQIAVREWPDLGLVVCESFIPRPGVRTWQPDALELIGYARHMCRQNEVTFRTQTPAKAKAFATDEKLKKLGWYWPGHGHANDAARHALVAAIDVCAIRKEDLL
jgi:hypothetical protein